MLTMIAKTLIMMNLQMDLVAIVQGEKVAELLIRKTNLIMSDSNIKS